MKEHLGVCMWVTRTDALFLLVNDVLYEDLFFLTVVKHTPHKTPT